MVLASNNAYSLRRLNPFNGILQVFETRTARALSSNGLKWEIQILSDSPQGLWANTPFSGKLFYTFGIWSQADGLYRVPLNPLFNTTGLLESAQEILDQLSPALEDLPFSRSDLYENWLLDEETGQPIALLDSACTQQELTEKEFKRWTAVEPGNFHFVSAQLCQRGLPTHDGHNPRLHASALEALVRGRGGQNHRRGWFYRHQGGTATPLDSGRGETTSVVLPELPLTLVWDSPADKALVMDYLEWKSPQLLLLSELSLVTRDWLERIAVKYAREIERYWRLYPQIHNKSLLNTARVEARIRLANQT